ncbi:hypothetical protein JXA40_10425 [bacterium]|nr:hypothetical protein [candidate division CSSED10-310 bacterium]
MNKETWIFQLFGVVMLGCCTAALCSNAPGITFHRDGGRLETVAVLEKAIIPDDFQTEGLNVQIYGTTRAGTITWRAEDWEGSYGAIADHVAIPADGSMIYVGWYLNYEKIAAFQADEDEIPEWEYDLLKGGTYWVSGSVYVAVPDDGSFVMGAVASREPAGGGAYESEVFCFDPANGSVIWSDIMPPAPSNPTDTESITLLKVAADGGKIAVASVGKRQDPDYDPFRIRFYDSAGTELHVIDISDPANEIMYLNDLDMTVDGTRMAADFRMNTDSVQMIKVYDLTTYSEVQTININNSPVQGSMGLSGDGGMLAVGDLRGKLWAYIYNGSLGEYEAAWNYTIPPDYYYPWVVSIDISRDGSTVAMGSYQPNQTDNNGYLYIFDASGPPYLFKSENAGDFVDEVSLSHDGQIAVGASWGPYGSTIGWDFLAYSRFVGTAIYKMETSLAGSNFDCGLSSSGLRAVTGGKRVHARDFGSGGYLFSIELDESGIPTVTPSPVPPTATPVPPTDTPLPTWTPVPTNTSLPTSTPVPTNTPIPTHTSAPPTDTPSEPTSTPIPPTDTPSPTETPSCPPSGAECRLNRDVYRPGDPFLLELIACNGNPTDLETIPALLLLDVYGSYFCAPTWTMECAPYLPEVDPCDCLTWTIFEFTWPSAGTGSAVFYAAMVDMEMTQIFGELSICPFSWEP